MRPPIGASLAPLSLALALALAGCTEPERSSITAPMAAAYALVAGECRVENLDDSGPGSLREKIGDPDCTLITFDDGVTGEIPLTSGSLVIEGRNLTIRGPGKAQLVVRRAADAANFRVFYVRDRTVAITDLTISGGRTDQNSPDGNIGGGIHNLGAELSLEHVTVSGNNAAGGGGIYNSGSLSLHQVTVSGNFASRAGGGIYNGQSATLVLSYSTVSGNSAAIESGGGIHTFAGHTTIYRSTIHENRGFTGGGIRAGGKVTISHTTISENTAFGGQGLGWGGGILVMGDVTLSHVTLIDNEAVTSGGGGIVTLGGSVSVDHSTIANNTSRHGGGGIWVFNGQALVVTNSTLSGNLAHAEGGAEPGGGAVYVHWGSATIVHSTVTGNQAPQGGGLWMGSGPHQASYDVRNSIIAGNTTLVGAANDVAAAATQRSGFVGFVTGGHNVIGAAGSNVDFLLEFNDPTDQTGVADPMLGPLQDNGGLTWTHALLPGSPAIDRIPETVSGCGTTVTADQRGEPRPQGAACDVGAYEAEPPGFAFSGFFAPVENLPTVNVMRAGRAIPIKFSLGGDQGLDILAHGYPHSQRYSCEDGNAQEATQEGTTAGDSGLSYDPQTDQYTYVWKTERSWAGTCRELTIKLSDQSERQLRFRFVR